MTQQQLKARLWSMIVADYINMAVLALHIRNFVSRVSSVV